MEMEIELYEIKNHIYRFPPFRNLPDQTVNELVQHIEIAYFRAGHDILILGQENRHLFFIRSGAVEIRRSSGEFFNRIGEGEIFGQFALLQKKRVRYPAKAIEDTLVYMIPDMLFEKLCDENDYFSDFVAEDSGSRLNSAINRKRHGTDHPLLTMPVQKLIHQKITTAPLSFTIQQAAEKMSREHASALVLVSDSDLNESSPIYIKGILTDRDLRRRAIAKGLPVSTPVEQVMSKNVFTQQADTPAFETLLAMMHQNIHHIPILKDKEAIGVVSISDIVQYQSHGAVYLIDKIFKQQSVEALVKISSEVSLSYTQMVNEGADSYMIGSALSGIGQSISQRLLQLAEKRLGPPPVPYCFLAMGSMARKEQLIVSDQDNALILDDSFNEKIHDPYFKSLAEFVSDGLAACGYPYCKGNVMATNPQWRQPLRVWKTYFSEWIETPDPQALLNASIFFDLCGIYGDQYLSDALCSYIQKKAPEHRHFLSLLAANALLRKPPLGFFRQFVLESDGEHKNSFNLKRRGTAPISDLVRVHALACGSKSVNTLDRLKDIHAAGLLPGSAKKDLEDAMEFLSITRIRNQVRQIEAGQTADNNVKPDTLSKFERRHLKDAFLVVSSQQAYMRMKHKHTGLSIQ